MGRTGIIVTGIIAIVLAIAGFIAFSGNDEDSGSQSASTGTGDTSTQPESATTISYNGSLFSPSQVTIEQGGAITVKNESSISVDFESDDHPVHTDNTELNAGEIEPGVSRSFTVNKAGSWGYHNHLNSSQTGTIVVR